MEKIEMPVTGRNGKSLLVGIAFDITEREQNLRLAEISTRILSGIAVEPDFKRVLDSVGQTAIDVLGCRRVIFAKVGGDGLLHFLRERGRDGKSRFVNAEIIAGHEKCWNSYLDLMKRNEILSFTRMGDDPKMMAAFSDYSDYADAALAATPVILRGNLIGVMIVSFATPRKFTEIEKRILHAITDCIVIAAVRERQDGELRRSQLEQARQAADQAAITECLNVFLNSDYMKVPFEQILEIIRKHLGASHCYALRIDPEKRLETCFAEARREGSEKFLAGLPPVPFMPDAFWVTELMKKGVVLWRDFTESGTRSRMAEQWREVVAAHKIHSSWDAALNPGGRMWGCLGIAYDDRTEREISPEDETFVRSAARLVSLILMRSLSRDDLIRTRDKLTAALDQAQAAEKAKSYFLASMSHEIRTPLNAVIGFTELMKDSAMDHESRQECLENIYSSGNALLQLINDILDLSKLEADQMTIIPERTDFQKFCTEVCRPFYYSASQKMLNLLVLISGTIPCLMLDQLRMRQILFNLVGNAIKFTKAGSVRIKASFTASSEFEGSLLLQVADTGIGILEADQKKLFEPFVQLSKMRGTNASNSGTGLGLVIVRKLVDKMGGTLTLESEEGKGSTFSILLPQVRIAPEESVCESRPEAAAPVSVLPVETGRKTVSEEKSHRQLRALVVDDVPMNAKILAAMLKKLHIAAETAHSGEEALEKLNGETFDWILTDLVMPGMNGVELVGEIRRIHPELLNTPLIGITAEQDALVFDKKIFTDVLTKPVSVNQLHDCLFQER